MTIKKLQTIASALPFALVLGACAGEVAPPLVEGGAVRTITAASVNALAPGEVIRVSGAPSDTMYVFDQTAGQIDFSRIEITCPNGRVMMMDAWIVEQNEVFGESLADNERLVLTTDPSLFNLPDEALDTLIRTSRYVEIGMSAEGLMPKHYECCSDGWCLCG